VVASVWAVVLLGLPLWWKTTAVYRAQLPFSQIDSWAERKVCIATLLTLGLTRIDSIPLQACQLSFPSTFVIHLASIADGEPQAHNRPLDFAVIQETITSNVNNRLASANARECVEFPLHVNIQNWPITSDMKSKYSGPNICHLDPRFA
jgi:Phosphatidylinositol-glycan biosynthesis class S protein